MQEQQGQQIAIKTRMTKALKVGRLHRECPKHAKWNDAFAETDKVTHPTFFFCFFVAHFFCVFNTWKDEKEGAYFFVPYCFCSLKT